MSISIVMASPLGAARLLVETLSLAGPPLKPTNASRPSIASGWRDA